MSRIRLNPIPGCALHHTFPSNACIMTPLTQTRTHRHTYLDEDLHVEAAALERGEGGLDQDLAGAHGHGAVLLCREGRELLKEALILSAGLGAVLAHEGREDQEGELVLVLDVGVRAHNAHQDANVALVLLAKGVHGVLKVVVLALLLIAA